MQDMTPSFLEALTYSAIHFGATDAQIIPIDMIPIEDRIIELCKKPLCGSYGNCRNCPPRAMPPSEFRKFIRNYEYALIFKVDVAPKVLLLDENINSFKIIYEIIAELEKLAIQEGLKRSVGLAAGSCKAVFCSKEDCSALMDRNKCRYPLLARPSMEAVGINVFKLIEYIGWKIYKITRDSDPDSIPSGMLSGLVLVG
ncbi:MAG: DUF2284 domain-containing protein [Desulfobacterales bacterium]|nr:DUF2284 domain-containing protein [Desulfobacterales bacterium]